jgi:hypothetical protein
MAEKTQSKSNQVERLVMQYFQWLAEEQGRPYWNREDKERYLVNFQVFFKDKGSYITEQGWVLGTECWVCSLDVYNRVRVKVCRAELEDCLKESVARIKLYLSGDDKWWVGINQEQIDKVFGA